MLGGPSAKNVGTNLISIDTAFGPVIMPGSGESELKDSISWGALQDNEDCVGPSGNDNEEDNYPCDHCVSSRGLLLPFQAYPAGAHLDR